MLLNLSYDASDQKIRTAIAAFDDLRYMIRNLVPSGYESYFQEQALYANAHSSTAIEGNPLDEEVAMLVLVDGAPSSEPDEIEKLNLAEVYQFIAQIGSDPTTWIDAGLIRALNSGILKGLPSNAASNRGRFRVGQSLIVDSWTREIRYRPPAAEDVPDLMKKYEYAVERWRDQHAGPIVAALAHFGLISIHPFDDGNGRAARLVADLIMTLSGWSIDSMISLNHVLFDRRLEYYEVLRQCQGDRYVEELDITAFVRFHTEALLQAGFALQAQVASFLRRRDRWTKDLHSFSSREVMALMYMHDLGPLSSTRLAQLTKTSTATSLADLTSLLDKRVVVREGGGPRTRYRLRPEIEQTQTEKPPPHEGGASCESEAPWTNGKSRN